MPADTSPLRLRREASDDRSRSKLRVYTETEQAGETAGDGGGATMSN